MPAQRVCWMCQKRGVVGEAPNGVGVCGLCIGSLLGHMLQGGRP
jgi:hypothetical protein